MILMVLIPVHFPPPNSHRQLPWCLSLPGVRGVRSRGQEKGGESRARGQRTVTGGSEGISLEEGMDP